MAIQDKIHHSSRFFYGRALIAHKLRVKWGYGVFWNVANLIGEFLLDDDSDLARRNRSQHRAKLVQRGLYQPRIEVSGNSFYPHAQ